MAGTRVSVIIRAKDEAASIGRTLDLLAGQTRPPDEVIVVDSGSSDATREIAVGRGARLIEIPAESFTFGGALNTGCAAATGDILVALSAHAFPVNPGWIARIVEVMADERVACCSGTDKDPDRDPLLAPVAQGAELARRKPVFGYSNGAGAFRADLWRQRGFREDMPATEDKEWALHWLDRGYVAMIDPGLVVEHDHSKDSVSEQYRRARIEQIGFSMFLEQEPRGLWDLARAWWVGSRKHPHPWRARLSHRRIARTIGRLIADRRDRRRLARAVAPKSLKVALVTDVFPALSETFVVNEAAELRRQGHRVLLEATMSGGSSGGRSDGVAYLDDEPLPAKLAAGALLCLRHPLAAARDLADRRRWAREEPVRPLRGLALRARRLQAAGVMHLHVHFAAGAALDTMRLGRLLGLPYSVTAHAYDIFESPANLTEKLEHSAFATTGCEYNRRHLRGLVSPAAGRRIHLQVMGVDPEEFRRRSDPPGARHVVAVGRLVEKKGFTYLLRAMAALEQTEPLDRVTIIGEGPLRDELEAETRSLGVEDRVALTGALPPGGVREALEGADLFVLPAVVAANGDRDSMPVVVKEAMAMEVPVVVSDEVGLPELVDEAVGRLAPPRDPDALAAAIGELLALSPVARRRMGKVGRARIKERCDVRAETARLAGWIAESDGASNRTW